MMKSTNAIDSLKQRVEELEARIAFKDATIGNLQTAIVYADLAYAQQEEEIANLRQRRQTSHRARRRPTA